MINAILKTELIVVPDLFVTVMVIIVINPQPLPLGNLMCVITLLVITEMGFTLKEPARNAFVSAWGASIMNSVAVLVWFGIKLNCNVIILRPLMAANMIRK